MFLTVTDSNRVGDAVGESVGLTGADDGVPVGDSEG